MIRNGNTTTTATAVAAQYDIYKGLSLAFPRSGFSTATVELRCTMRVLVFDTYFDCFWLKTKKKNIQKVLI